MDKKFWFQILGLVIIICLGTFFAFNFRYIKPYTQQFIGNSSGTRTPITPSSEVQKLRVTDPTGNIKAELNVEVADTKEERSVGLSNRETLASDSGMLFIHETPQIYTYWMKNTLIPLDMIWILGDEIVDIKANVPIPVEGQTDDTLERYAPITAINRVLETNAGFAAAHGIQKGDKIKLEDLP